MALIENLLALYKVDRQVRSLRNRVESAEIYLTVQNRQLNEIETEQQEIEQQQKQRKANIALAETEIGSIDERIVQHRDQLNHAVNDKEYSALLAEINTLKERRKAFEDEELNEMTALEALEATALEISTRFQEREKVTQVAENELNTRKTEVSDQLNELESERNEAAATIPAGTLEQFDSIADDFDGEAMAAIEVVDLKRREYSCTCCSLRLPLDSITQMIGDQNALITCGSCDRILYLEPETREAMSSSK
tara:strand:- start:315 stop:1070 length:756 start_codon:yes stop_codon:yes gene_type:complete